MADAFDIAVVGAGPAGGNAALAAAKTGLQVIVLDEQPAAGGQVWRGKSPSILSAPGTPEATAGDALRKALTASSAEHLPDTRVWDILHEGDLWHLQILRNETSEQISTRALVLATGAREYVQPLPGWTTPGVIGLSGATALFKQSLSLPGQNTIVSGTGPLVFYVASEIRRLGGQVAAVVTPNTSLDWARALPVMMLQPKLMARGALWIADLMLARVPILWGHAVSGVEGGDRVTGARTRNLRRDADGPSFVADSVCLGHGLVPQIEAAQMLGVPISYDPALGGWVPKAEPDGATPVSNLYLCGDGIGIRGAAAAGLQGTLTGARVARDLGQSVSAPSQRAWQRAARFGKAMTALSLPRADLAAIATEDTVLCRCESLTRAEISAEINAGATSSNAVKSGRRAGMGSCGGKYCQTVIAALIAAQTGKAVGDIPPSTPRPPLRPVPLGQVAAEFDYDDLPIPKPAPL